MGDRGGQFKKADTPPKLFVWRGIDKCQMRPLCERKVDIACCCEARIQNRVDKRTFVISPTSTTINSSIQPSLSFVDILCTRVQFIQMESLSCWGWLLFDASICWGNNGNGVVKLIHCNTSKGKKMWNATTIWVSGCFVSINWHFSQCESHKMIKSLPLHYKLQTNYKCL